MRQSPVCEARAMLVAWEHRDSLPFVLRFELSNYTATSGTNKDGLAHSTQDSLKRAGPWSEGFLCPKSGENEWSIYYQTSQMNYLGWGCSSVWRVLAWYVRGGGCNSQDDTKPSVVTVSYIPVLGRRRQKDHSRSSLTYIRVRAHQAQPMQVCL